MVDHSDSYEKEKNLLDVVIFSVSNKHFSFPTIIRHTKGQTKKIACICIESLREKAKEMKKWRKSDVSHSFRPVVDCCLIFCDDL